MALPQWITPAGNLGIVPDLEYYEFNLDAYDESGGTLIFSLVSGRLPPGIQVLSPPLVPQGQLRGIPLAESLTESNNVYKFTIRVTNTVTRAVADRTFSMTITNVKPPIITPRGDDNVVVFGGNLMTANVGDYLIQNITGANAVVIADSVKAQRVSVNYISANEFVTTSTGNAEVNVTIITTGIYPSNSNPYVITANLGSFPSTVESNNKFLGVFPDGELINIQLNAIDESPNATLSWSLKRGDIPDGLTLTSEGLLTGYITPIPTVYPGFTPGWDASAWAALGWDFKQKTATKTFTFVVEVTDGVNYDQAAYTLTVAPRGFITADDSITRVNDEFIQGILLTADLGKRHNPIFTTQQSDIPFVRQNSYVALNIDAIDIDGDFIKFSVPALASGAFDEQIFSASVLSYPYIAEKPTDARMSKGVFPKVTISTSAAIIDLYPGNLISAAAGDTITQPESGATAIVTANVTNSPSIPIIVTGSNFTTTRGNLKLNNQDLELAVPNASIISANIAPYNFVTGSGNELSLNGNLTAIYPLSVIRNTIDNYTLNLSGGLTANVGEFITQGTSGANALILSNVVANTTITVQYVAGFWANIPIVPRSVVLEGQTTVYDFTRVNYQTGDIVKVQKDDVISGITYPLWHLATVNNSTTITCAGPTPLQVTNGDTLAQPFSTASGTVTNVAPATTTIEIGGTVVVGNIEIYGTRPQSTLTLSNPITASVGNIITQLSSGANATVISNVSNSFTVSIEYNTVARFVNTSSSGDRLALNGANIVVAPTWTNNTAVTFTTTGTLPPPLLANVVYYTTSASSNMFKVSILPGFTEIDITGTGSGIHTIVNTNQTFTANVANIIVVDNANVFVSTISVFPNTITLAANIGDFITQDSTGANAIVTADVVDAINIPVRYVTAGFTTVGGNLKLNGSTVNVFPVTQLTENLTPAVSINTNDYVTQTGGNANVRVEQTKYSTRTISGRHLVGLFNINGGNLIINGTEIDARPISAFSTTDVRVTYGSSATFRLNVANGNVTVNGNPTNNAPVDVVDVGIAISGSPAVEGTVGFDEGKFEQGTLGLPPGLSLNENTGWITGYAPTQIESRKDYQFEVLVYKRDLPIYRSPKLFNLSVLGDLNNKIEWITPENIGSIYNGKISDLFISAVSTRGKTLYYDVKPNGTYRLPQGLILTSNGLLSGRVSFELFSLDGGVTTLDKNSKIVDETTLDRVYRFTVRARDIEETVEDYRTFTLTVIAANEKPYEDLWLRALPTESKRIDFLNLMSDQTIFPPSLIYREEDPFFGRAKELQMMFLPGLNPSTLAAYTEAAAQNHYTKRLTFGEIKTARALDENLQIKYEVVYVEVKDANTNDFGLGPEQFIDLSNVIENPYYDAQGNEYSTVYPNAFSNMRSRMETELGYSNKGALPDWMTSKQVDGRILGFTRGVVLAYAVPDAAEIIAYRLKQSDFNLNSIDFTVDRYQVDNNLTENYNITSNTWIVSNETTFDRYPVLTGAFTDAGTVDYALSTSFESIAGRSVSYINSIGGLDGITNFQNGDYVVFAQQEYRRDQADIGEYNQGWSNILSSWDGDPWAFNSDTTDSDTSSPSSDSTPGLAWDKSEFVPGYVENLLDPTNINKRIGVWEVNINENNIVSLTFVKAINYYDKLYVRRGNTYGRTNIFYDPLVKNGNTYPNYSLINQNVKTTYTTFDGNGTRFFDNRDEYAIPGVNDKYIKFTKTGVFT